MKSLKFTRANVFIFAILCFSALLIAVEIRAAATVLKLKENIAECRAMTERSTSRARMLAELLGRMQDELERAKNLPVALASNAESLETAIENCAVASGISCAVSGTDEKDGKVSIEISFRGTQQELLTFLRGLLALPETFFVSALECRSIGDGLNVRLLLSAFIKTEAR